MATYLRIPPNVGDLAHLLKTKGPNEGGEPVADKEGNYISDDAAVSKRHVFEDPEYDPTSRIPRLARAAALDKPVPTAGQWGIDHVIPNFPEIPPECYLYDEDRPWVLEKLNPAALDLPEPCEPIKLSQKTLDYLDSLDAKYGSAALQNPAPEEEPAAPKKVTIVTEPNVNVTDKSADAKVKPKTRGPSSPSPARRAGTGRSSTSPGKDRLARADKTVTGRPKTPKSPGPVRGVSPQAKIVASSGPKKVMNAKVDLEIVEKKN